MNTATKALMGLVVALSLAGCTVVNAAPAPATSSSAETENPYGGFAVANPAADEVILTVTNGDKTIDFSTMDLKKLETTEVTIDEPFVNKKQTFVGVPMSVLFDSVGIKSTDKVSTLALNDYKYDDLAGKFTESKGIIAFLRDGTEIPMDQGGPIRIVFPSATPYFDYLDAWNWSIRSISIAE